MKTPQIEHGALDPNTGAEITTPLGIPRPPDYWIGKRVQIPAWSELWAMGDRYGEVVAHFRPQARDDRYCIKLDKSSRTTVFAADDLKEVLCKTKNG